jgi:hypothetical protein
MNGWLDRRPVWQFVVIWGGCIFLALLIAGTVGQLAFGHPFDFAFILGYAGIFAVTSATGATFARRRRMRCRRDTGSEAGRWRSSDSPN